MITINELVKQGQLTIAGIKKLQEDNQIDLSSVVGQQVIACSINAKMGEVLGYVLSQVSREALTVPLRALGLKFENFMQYAAFSGNIEAMQLISECGMGYDVQDTRGLCAMHSAAAGGQIDAMLFLHETAGLAYDVADSKGYTPMHIAAARSQQAAMVFLNEVGCVSYGVLSNQGNTPMYNATQYGREAIKAFLRSKGVENISVAGTKRTSSERDTSGNDRPNKRTKPEESSQIAALNAENEGLRAERERLQENMARLEQKIAKLDQVSRNIGVALNPASTFSPKPTVNDSADSSAPGPSTTMGMPGRRSQQG